MEPTRNKEKPENFTLEVILAYDFFFQILFLKATFIIEELVNSDFNSHTRHKNC